MSGRVDLSNIGSIVRTSLGRVIAGAFRYGIDCDFITAGGLIVGQNEQTILEESVTQRYLIGTRLQTKDGRVFRYCKAGEAITNSLKGLVNDYKPYEGDRPGTAYVIGDTEITIPSTSTGNAVANDAVNSYQNGYIWFQMTPHQFHLIASNTVKVGTTQVLTLAEGLKAALPSSASGGDTLWVTIWPSIYSNVKNAGGGQRSIVCASQIDITSGYYFWGQTWGPHMFVAGGTAPGRTGSYRRTVFQTDGSILDASAGAVGHQTAGYILSQTTASDGDQLVMMQLAP